MWKSSVVAVSALAVTGCGMVGPSGIDRQIQYDAYLQAQARVAEMLRAAPPIVDASWVDSGGQPMRLVVNLPLQVPRVEQIKADESLQFWGQVLAAALPTVGLIGSQWISGHYNAKSQDAMWAAIGGGFGGGWQIGDVAGDIALHDSANVFAPEATGGSAVGIEAMNAATVSGYGSHSGGAWPTASQSTEVSETYTQAGGEDSNLIQ